MSALALAARRIGGRLVTIGQLFAYFTQRNRLVLVPLLIVLLLAALFLVFTGGLSLVAPLVYPLM